MRWTVISIAAMIILMGLGFYIVAPDNLNIAQKTCYWLVVTAFVTAQCFHGLSWLRNHDL